MAGSTAVTASPHVVQFYESDAFLGDEVARFLGTGLRVGERAFLIATAAHRADVIARLGELGVDVHRATAEGRFVELDARATLDRLLCDGMPDAARFQDVIGDRIVAASRQGPTHAFGEMVALLHQEGRTHAVLALEQLWNDLGATCNFALLCAYPLRGFGSAADGEALAQICAAHSDIVPAEGFSRLPSPEARQRQIVELQHRSVALDHEVVQRVRAEASERHSTAMLRSVVAGSPVPIVVIEPDMTVRLWNSAAEDVFGWAESEVLGRPLPIVPADKRDERARFRAVATRGESFRNVETRRLRRDGSVVDVLMSAAPLRDAGGVVREIVLLLEDVTERHALHAAERRARQEAETANRAKDEFLAMLGHELRNPLSALQTAVATARRDVADRDRALEIAERQTRHLGNLVDDLLDVARITHGKITLARAPVRVAAVIAAAVETMRPLIAERGHALAVALPAPDLGVAGDATRLEQVLVNLLSNAAKYTNPGGHLEVLCARVDDRVAITVRDDGQGLSPEMAPRVFEIFHQGVRPLDRSEGGLGLGLTLVRKIVELHGGTVAVRSDGLGRGSAFTVTLPALTLPVDFAARHPCVDEPATRSARRVLLVDDNVDAADSLKMLLETMGHRVAVAYDGPTALAAAAADPPDVMVVDIGLPGIDGYEVARRVRADTRLSGVIVAALTGYGRPEDRARALAAGFDLHLLKPVNVDALRALIARAAA